MLTVTPPDVGHILIFYNPVNTLPLTSLLITVTPTTTSSALGEALVHCTRDLSTHLAIADLLYALGQMGVALADLSPDHQQRLKASICR